MGPYQPQRGPSRGGEVTSIFKLGPVRNAYETVVRDEDRDRDRSVLTDYYPEEGQWQAGWPVLTDYYSGQAKNVPVPTPPLYS